MKHDDGTEGHNFACKVCGAWVSEYGCVRVLFPQPNTKLSDAERSE